MSHGIPNANKKFKRPILNTQATTNPDAPRPRNHEHNEDRSERPEPEAVPLLAKDSEWVDIVQTPLPAAAPAAGTGPSGSNVGDDEAVLHLVDCEDGPESEPLAIMFPGLLERDPQTFEGMLTKAMSTTEVTRHLVDLGAKANFQFVKKSNRLIPPNKQWLEKVSEAETSNSHCSFDPSLVSGSYSSDYPADNENIEEEEKQTKKKKRRKSLNLATTSKRTDSARTLTSSSSSNKKYKRVTVTTALAIVDQDDHSNTRRENK